MNYKKIWEKTLSAGEVIEYEFSIGKRYRIFMFVCWLLISIALMFIVIGWFTLAFAAFYFLFYIPRANAYAITNKRVLIHKGWLNTKLISVDFNKITDIRISEKFFDKLLTKTGSLVINTAGTSLLEIVLKNIQDPYEVRKKLDKIRAIEKLVQSHTDSENQDIADQIKKLAELRDLRAIDENEYQEKKNELLKRM